MRIFKRCGATLAAAAAVTALVAAPAAAAVTTPPAHPAAVSPNNHVTGYGIDCATLTAQLNSELQAAAAALASTPPDVTTAQAEVAAAQATLIQLQAEGCLQTPEPPVSCTELLNQLRQNAQALIAAVNATPQDPAAIAAALVALQQTAEEIRENHCVVR